MKTNKEIFQKASTTFYTSSLFFPKKIRNDVFTLYAYVRTADDYVDNQPADKKGFLEFKAQTNSAWLGKKVNDQIVENFITLAKKAKIKKDWIDAFLAAMESDLSNTKCKTFAETKKYMYGSAEVVGLMMCAVMNIDKQAYKYAQALGAGFQYINFIRDVDEDNRLKRQYLPIDEMKLAGLSDLKVPNKAFDAYVRAQVLRWEDYITYANDGFGYLPYYCRVPVMTATDLYVWTGKQIRKDPHIVFKKKVKPHKIVAMLYLLKNIFGALRYA